MRWRADVPIGAAAYDAWMDPQRLAAFRAALTEERHRLLEEIADAAPEAPGQMTYGSQAAMASEVFAQQRDLALRDRSTRQLEAVDAALERLDEGTFGTCRSCSRPIAEERLEARPWAALCIDCQRLEDR
jgi:DnaK suppressor protein